MEKKILIKVIIRIINSFLFFKISFGMLHASYAKKENLLFAFDEYIFFPSGISPDISLFYIRVMHLFYFTTQQQSYGIWRQLWILKEFVLLRFLLLLCYFSFLSVFLSELFLVRRRKISCDYVLFNLRFGWQMFINFSWYAVRRFQLFFCFSLSLRL